MSTPTLKQMTRARHLASQIVGKVHGQGFSATVAELSQHSLMQMLAKCLLMLLVQLPFIAIRELNKALGPGTLKRVLLEVRK
jgi:hypothetical protein